MEPFFKARQLVEVSGLKDEGFPGSFVLAVVLETDNEAATVQYMEFVDDDTKMQLEERIELHRLRPALPSSAAHFNNWDQLQAGMCVEAHQDDVWWQGVVIRKTPAGVHVYMPEVDHSTSFVKLLKNLRPAYDWIPSSSSSSKQQQSCYWSLRQLSDEQLMTMFEVAPDAQTINPLPTRLEYEPTFSELTRIKTSTQQQQAAAAAAEDNDAEADQADDHDQLLTDAAATTVRDQVHKQQQGEEVRAKAEETQQQQQHVSVKEEDDEHHDSSDSDDDDDDDPEQHHQPPAAAAAASGPSSRKRAVPHSPSRRSSRSVKKRVVYVEGVPVLRDNLYGPEGEPSVYDRELAGVTPGANLPTEPPLSPAAKMKQQQLQHMRQQRQQQQQNREQRCLSPSKKPSAKGHGGSSSSSGQKSRQTAAQQHNAGVKADIKATSQTRSAYLATHLDKLKPFIAPAVSESLERAAAAAPPGLLTSLPSPPDQQPGQVRAVLRQYQLEGLAWLVAQHHRGLNSILADEMGLGKTLQTITFLADLKYRLGVSGPHLIVVPLSVMSSWMNEFSKWCPSLRVLRLHTSDQEERKRIKKEVLSHPDSFDVALTTYEMVSSHDFGRIIQSTLRWRYLVLDEGHRVRNLDTLTATALKRVQTSRVLLLTGTPLQNNMVELFGLLSFLYPDIFTTPGPFEAAFNLSKGQVDTSALSAAHYLLRPFCLRRLKEEVELSLPPKVETRIAVPLAPQQIFWYRRLLLRNHEALSALESAVINTTTSSSSGGHTTSTTDQQSATTTSSSSSSDSNAWRKLQFLLIQLRKVVDHPYLMPDSEPGGEGTATLQELIEASGKLSVLDRLLCRLKARGHRVVLFSQFNMMLDILEDYLEQAGYEYTRLDGGVNRVQRMINISQFMRPDSTITVFLASTRAGGLGLNLQAADTVILYDSDWNPQWDMQAMARVHRIGQTRPVHIYRLVTSSSVEERMLQRADAKLYLDQMVNRGSTAKAHDLDGVSGGEMLAMLSFGADRVLANEAGQPPTDEELENILDRSKDTAAAAAARSDAAAMSRTGSSSDGPAAAAATSVKSVQLTAATFQPAAPPPSTFTLNGVDYSREALNKLRQEAAAEAAAAARNSSSSSSVPSAVKKLCGERHQSSEEGVKAALKQIAREYWENEERKKRELQQAGSDQRLHPARSREARLMTVEGYQVLKSNNYTFEQGGRTAWEETRAGVRPANGGNPPKRTVQKAGRDYAHADTCQVCWDGGDLICCDVCPAAYHAECVGQDINTLARCRHWACPHHSCAACGRGPAAAGGLLFKCCVCENAYCEDHLPADHEILGEWELFKALGQHHPTNACFIHCGPDCVDLHERLRPVIQQTIQQYTDNPELRYKEALEDEAGNKKAVKKGKKKT